MSEQTFDGSTGPRLLDLHAVSDERVKRFILDVLDDFKRHDWDDAMIEVDEGFEKFGERLGPRQSCTCLAELIAQGLVKEEPHPRFGADWLTLRRVRPKNAERSRSLFE